MRNSFDILDWIRDNLGGSGTRLKFGKGLRKVGDTVECVDADNATAGIVKLANDIAHAEANGYAATPDGVAAYVEAGFVPMLQKKQPEVNAALAAGVTGTAKCMPGAGGVLITMNLTITQENNVAIATFKLPQVRFTNTSFIVYLNGYALNVTADGDTLAIKTTAKLENKTIATTAAIPYF